jgi:hypothetical protein
MSRTGLLFAVVSLWCLTAATKTIAQQQATGGTTTVVRDTSAQGPERCARIHPFGHYVSSGQLRT